MVRWMDGWIDNRNIYNRQTQINGQISKKMDKKMKGWMDRQNNRQVDIDEWMHKQINGQISKNIDKQMKEQMDKRMDS